MIINKIEQIISENEIEFTLMDIGASGDTHEPFRQMLSYSTLIRFDPDLRDMQISEQSGKGKIITMNKAIVAEDNIDMVTFFLTKNPHCSSTLEPNSELLSRFCYAEFFEVIDTAEVPSTTITRIMNETNRERIDWIKLDTQGTDLRIIKSLSDSLLSNLLVCDIEPGFYNHYHDSDTFDEVHKFMVNNGFWLADLNLQKQTRIAPMYYERLLNKIDSKLLKREIKKNLKRNPTAPEARYIRTIQSATDLNYDISLFLRLWACSIYSNNVEFSYNVISHVEDNNPDDLSIKNLRSETENYLIKKGIMKAPLNIGKAIFRKLFN